MRCWYGYLCGTRCRLFALHPKTPSSLASFKSRLVLPFWYQLIQVVLEKRPLNGCSSSSSSSCCCCNCMAFYRQTCTIRRKYVRHRSTNLRVGYEFERRTHQVCFISFLFGLFMSLLTQYFPPLGKLTSKCQEWVNRATTRLAVAIGSEDRRSSQR